MARYVRIGKTTAEDYNDLYYRVRLPRETMEDLGISRAKKDRRLDIVLDSTLNQIILKKCE